jgi:uncharacterized protein
MFRTVRFVDRHSEMQRLRGVQRPGLVVVWGRRRVGKTRLLLEWTRADGGIYTVADLSAGPVQRRYFAEAVSAHAAGFADVEYPDWRALLRALSRELGRGGKRRSIVVDEFPYLVASSPELPSTMQAWVDHEAKDAGVVLVLAGSSRRMMQGAALDPSSPLYGRAHEAFEVRPLSAAYIAEAQGFSQPADAIRAYAAWGGIPWYWELAARFGVALEDALDALVLDPSGPLHQEPEHLLAEETPSAAALRPILDVVGAGAHRVSEIAARLGQPATSLSRPLAQLVELGFLRREQPFGDPTRSSKRTLYRIDDPFFRLWFRVVAPHRALLHAAPARARREPLKRHMPALRAQAWEQLCREATPRLTARGLAEGAPWGNAQRYWHGNGPEWDLVAHSLDGKCLLLGEVRWCEKPVTERVLHQAFSDLVRKGTEKLPDSTGRRPVYAVFVPVVTPALKRERRPFTVIDAEDVLAALRG